MDKRGLDDIEALKATQKKKKYTDEEIAELRKSVKEIMRKREVEEKARRRVEMKRFYDASCYFVSQRS